MSLISSLPSPLNTIKIENKVGSYKDFGASSSYPLKGVTYHAKYGYLPEYTGEDGDGLDFFVGTDSGGKAGYFLVWRSEDVPKEHKYFICMSDEELAKTLNEYTSVLVGKEHLHASISELVSSIARFRDNKS